MKNAYATLTLPEGKSVNFPILKGSLGEDVINIQTLKQETGYFTYDPGFLSTASCESKLTFIDGDKGVLLHRGYPIQHLAQRKSFMDVAHLLLFGELPSSKEFQAFEHNIKMHTLLNEQVSYFFRGFRRDAHPMAILVGTVGALSAFYHDSHNMADPEQRKLCCYRLIAKVPTIAAMAYKYHIGQPFIYPQNKYSFTENVLSMLFGLPTEPYEPNPVVVKALDQIFILHADHEQNASTSTVRLVASTGANPYACISSGIAALWGPSHGGANEAVLNMLTEIGSVKNIPRFLEQVRAKEKKLMGFGHRVYKNHDPRAEVLKESAHQVFKALGVSDPYLDVALELERLALRDDYFVERKLFPNVDFYSGLILRAMGVPTSMFTAFFAIARTVGWTAQWYEMLQEPLKIGRPRQLYKGETERSVE